MHLPASVFGSQDDGGAILEFTAFTGEAEAAAGLAERTVSLAQDVQHEFAKFKGMTLSSIMLSRVPPPSACAAQRISQAMTDTIASVYIICPLVSISLCSVRNV